MDIHALQMEDLVPQYVVMGKSEEMKYVMIKVKILLDAI